MTHRALPLALLAIAAALSAFHAFAPAAAADDPWTFEIDVASEYVSKGRGRSDGQAHAAARVERTVGPAYAGAWLGSVKASDGADGQANLYVGVKTKVGDWRLDARLSQKTRLNVTPNADDDAWEGRIDATRAFGANNLRLRIEATPDNYGSTEESVYVEARLQREIADGWTVSSGLGRREQSASPDYTAWNVGATAALGAHAELDLRWFDTDGHAFDESYDGRLVAALTISF